MLVLTPPKGDDIALLLEPNGEEFVPFEADPNGALPVDAKVLLDFSRGLGTPYFLASFVKSSSSRFYEWESELLRQNETNI